MPANRPIELAIDHYIDAKLKENNVKPARPADDAAILRRLTLDLNGRVPTLGEMREYLADSTPGKKAKLVDRLMASPAFARHNAQTFYAFMQYADGQRHKGDKGNPLYDYLFASFNDNRGWDRMFREMMLPDEKNPKMGGADDFLKMRVKDLNKLAIDTSSIFFGVNVSCAQCHDHPHVQAWTQDQFYGMKSFFVRTIDAGGFIGERDFGVVKYTPNKGKEKISPIVFLAGKNLEVPGMKEPSGEERKKEQTAPRRRQESEDAAGAADVQLASQARGDGTGAAGILRPQYRQSHGASLFRPRPGDAARSGAQRESCSHPELLDWLARDLAEHGYDLRRLTVRPRPQRCLRPLQPLGRRQVPRRTVVRGRPSSPAGPAAISDIIEAGDRRPDDVAERSARNWKNGSKRPRRAVRESRTCSPSRPTIFRWASPRQCCSRTTRHCRNHCWKGPAR